MVRLRYFGERNEAAPYPTNLGWELNAISVRNLFADNDLQPSESYDLRMSDLIYVSGTLKSTK